MLLVLLLLLIVLVVLARLANLKRDEIGMPLNWKMCPCTRLGGRSMLVAFSTVHGSFAAL